MCCEQFKVNTPQGGLLPSLFGNGLEILKVTDFIHIQKMRISHFVQSFISRGEREKGWGGNATKWDKFILSKHYHCPGQKVSRATTHHVIQDPGYNRKWSPP